jgi:hypothetical protein
MRSHILALVLGTSLAGVGGLALPASAQPPTAPASSPSGVPLLVRVSGTVPWVEGVATVTFALYAAETGGDPIWSEAQPVSIDAVGRYAVVLGVRQALTTEVFGAGGSRWLGVRAEGGSERPRSLIISVPYAIKAGDAETLGGYPPSAFVLAGSGAAGGLQQSDDAGATARSRTDAPRSATAGAANYLSVFVDATTLGASALYQTTAGRIGVNTTAPLAPFHVTAPDTPAAFFDAYSGGSVLGALPVVQRAARGTPLSPSAVQANDILGGLAVRGFGATAFSGGRGQVMFRAAETWTDSANGTFLQFTTTPVASTSAQERLRITPAGLVGIGTTSPGQRLSVAGTIESTSGGFRFPDGSTQTTAVSRSANTFSGTQSIASGNIELPSSAGPGSGVLTMDSVPFLHGYPGTASENLFAGGHAGGGFATTGRSNTGLGSRALFALTSGVGNTAVGADSLASLTIGYNNTAVGGRSLSVSVSGMSNSAFGASALAANVNGSSNSAFGAFTLAATVAGIGNTAIGSHALSSTVNASYNSALGYASLHHNTTGASNTGLGYGAGTNITTGSFNTFVGYGAGTDAAFGGLLYSAALGAMARVTQDHSIALGGTGDAAVNVGINTPAPDTRLQVVGDIKVGTNGSDGCIKNFAGSGIAGACSSDGRLKTDVRALEPMLDRVASLTPVRFSWRSGEFPAYHFGDGPQVGLIAQDVERLFPELVALDADGFKTVNYSELPLLTLQAVKELKAENNTLKTENQAMRAQLAALAERLFRLEHAERR